MRRIFRTLSLLIVGIEFSIVKMVEIEAKGMLFPQDSETREIKSLDGLWNFRISPKNSPNLGFTEKWYSRPLQETGDVEIMPVPSSYNDITQNKLIRDHIGWAWYDRTFWIPNDWLKDTRLVLRFGGVNYHATVWINGIPVVEHSGGHLPFEIELSSPPVKLLFKSINRITVAINNTLTPDTVPQGEIFRPTDTRYPEGYFTLNYNFDFFNYAGIHRSVFLYTTPQTYISDITVHTRTNGETGILDYSIQFLSSQRSYLSITRHKVSEVSVSLLDKKGVVVGTGEGESGQLLITDAKLWWPFTMVKNDTDAGYLHTLVVTLTDATLRTKDVYRLKIGIRSVKWTNTSLLINDKPFYFRGFGRHEDFNIRGKGIDNVMIVKDHNLVKWTGANSYRTSHYPYAEEIMDLTDRLGIVVIDECPAVSLNGFGSKLLSNHMQSIRELIQRDKNRASVIMWSVGNEPQSQQPAAENYFKEVIDLTRSLDETRPITLVLAQDFERDVTAKYLDIICINRYFSWYSDTGHTEVIEKSMIRDVQNWVQKFNKPVIVAEYGADTIAGIHSSPDFVFSEEYQVTMMREHFKAFDYLRKHTSLIGEHIWNFADFMTAQGLTRVLGNRKGIFTRERQPKASAHFLRTRYHLLAKEIDDYPIPFDLHPEYPIYTD